MRRKKSSVGVTGFRCLGYVLLAAAIIFACHLPAMSQEGDSFDPKEPVFAGYKLIEGDIQVPVTFSSDAFSMGSVYSILSLWPDGDIPYEFDANVSADNRTRALQSMALWEAAANITFRPRAALDAVYFVHIQNSTGNSSPVGRVIGGNFVNIVSWTYPYIIAHELAHTLGFWHEQSRGDRDSFIQVELGNIQAGREYNFDIHNEANHYGPYDFDSVMHYTACSFSECSTCSPSNVSCRTITVKAPYSANWQVVIGQRGHFSTWDMLVMSFLYPYPDWRFLDKASLGSAESGSFIEPYTAFDHAVGETPDGGTLWILQSATYSVQRATTLARPMTLRAPLGDVVFYAP